MVKLMPMSQNKTSSKVYGIIKSAASAAMLPIIFIYIMIAKPDYRIMNMMAHVVVPVGVAVGDAITWPVRAIGRAFDGIHNISNLRAENEELRVRLDDALRNRDRCEVAILENQKMAHELDVIAQNPRHAISARVRHTDRALGHDTFTVDRGTRDGVRSGMVVVSFDGRLVGIVADAGVGYSRVRALTHGDTNIAVRVAGSEVYGFLSGNGSRHPTMGFFSDPEFQAGKGIKLITSNISGILPDGIVVGEMIDDTDVDVTPIGRLSNVMILQFDTADEYK